MNRSTPMSRRSMLWALAAPVLAARPLAAGQARPSFQGSVAGEQRDVDGVRLCWCPAGRFVMGSPASEVGHRPDESQVQVTLTRGFWIGKFEATQGQWKRLVGDFPDRTPSVDAGEGDDVPVYWVNIAEAERFCEALTRRGHASGSLPADWVCRLPTEAQWEYACRAGTTTATSFGDRLDRTHANFDWEASGGGAPHPASRVGSYPANAWGIHDMHGNIFEWCRDWYHSQLPGGTDPDLSGVRGTANRDGTWSRVRRGGAANDEAWACRSAFRLRYEPERRADHIGFRVVLVRL